MDFEIEIIEKVEELILKGEWRKATLLLLEERGKLLSELLVFREKAEKERERKRRYTQKETEIDGNRRKKTEIDGNRRKKTEIDGKEEKEKEKSSKKEKEKEEKNINIQDILDCSDNLNSTNNENTVTYDESKLCFSVGAKLLEKYYGLYGKEFVDREIEKAAMWVASVPKTRWKKDWRKFLYNWLHKAYDIELSKKMRQNSFSSQLPANILQLNSADTFARALAKMYHYESWDSIESKVRADVFEWQQYHKFRESFSTVLSLVKKYYLRAIAEREKEIYRSFVQNGLVQNGKEGVNA